MYVQKRHRKAPNSPTLLHFISQHADIAEYFAKNAGRQGYQALAVQLWREAINAGNSKQKHYNVSYVKHKRFLSPSQKQQVAPKVTEVIPVSPDPIKIYGKPRVRLNDQFFPEEEPSPKAVVQIPERSQSQAQLNRHIPQQEPAYPVQMEIQSQTYLSPKNKKASKTKQVNSQTEIVQSRENMIPIQKLQETKLTTKGELKIDSNFRTTMKEDRQRQLQSPKPVCQKQNYQNVSSRIKFLIDQDKKDSKLRKQLEEQNRVLDKLQKRQQKLLERQYKQNKELAHVKSQPELACCCCSSDDEIEARLLQLRANKTNTNYHSTISNIKSKLSPSKLYKVSSNELYPLSSSEQEEQSSLEVGVVPLY